MTQPTQHDVAIDTTIGRLVSVAREIRTQQFELSEKRHRLATTLRLQIAEALLANLPTGYEQFTAAFLGATGNSYLEMSLRGPNGGISNGARLVRRVLTIKRTTPNTPAYMTAEDGTIVGQFTADSVPGPRSERFDYWTNRAAILPVWTKMHFANARHDDNILLPVAGRVATEHGPLRRLAALADELVNGSACYPLLETDAKMDGLAARYQATQDVATAAALDSDTPEHFKSLHPGLVERMQRHDWSYREADCSKPAAAQEEKAIMAALSEIP